jgi:hypothetical protein
MATLNINGRDVTVDVPADIPSCGCCVMSSA